MKHLRKGLTERIDRHGAALPTDARALLLERVVAEINGMVDAVADRSIRSTVYDRPALAQFWPIQEFAEAEDDGGQQLEDLIASDEQAGDEDEVSQLAATAIEKLDLLTDEQVEAIYGARNWMWLFRGWPSNVSAKQAAEAFTRLLTPAERDAVALEAEKGARSDFWPRTIVENIYDPILTPAGVDELTKAMARRVERTAPVELQPLLQAVVARAKAMLPRVVLVVSAINEAQEARDAHVRVPTAAVSAMLSVRSGDGVEKHDRAPRNDDTFTTLDLRRISGPTSTRVRFDVERRGRFNSLQLSLPLERYSQGSPFAEVRRFLTDWDLRAYLGLFALPTPDGGNLFALDPRSFLLDVLGRGTTQTKVRGKLYDRPLPRDERLLRDAIEKFQSIAFTRINDRRGDLTFEKPERLVSAVNRVEHVPTGRVADVFMHSPFLWKLTQRDFVQMPRAAMRLDAEHAALAAGIALVIRENALAGAGWLESGQGLTLSLDGWARRAGEPVDERLRRDGRAWWSKVRGRLELVAKAGGFGRVAVGKGDHGDQLVTLELSPVMSTVYAPLLVTRDKAVEALDWAQREAETRKLMATPSKPGRPRKPMPKA